MIKITVESPSVEDAWWEYKADMTKEGFMKRWEDVNRGYSQSIQFIDRLTNDLISISPKLCPLIRVSEVIQDEVSS